MDKYGYTYFHKLVARLLLPCDKVVAWLLQPWHFYMGSNNSRQLQVEANSTFLATMGVIPNRTHTGFFLPKLHKYN